MAQNSQNYRYHRVLLKLSGEALAGDAGFGINQEIVDGIARQVAQLNADGVQLAIVIGGGNYFRGAKGSAAGMDRSLADSIGMMATVMNSLALQDAFERFGAPTAVLSAIEIQGVCETYSHRAAIAHLEAGHVVVFAAGTGRPYFTTDTAGALRACEIGAQALLKATKVDGVYDSDPVKNPAAVKFDRITYAEVLARDLRVMDAAATSLCKDNGVPVIVFNMFEEGNIARVLRGEAIGTTVE